MEFYSLYRDNVHTGFVETFFIFLTSVCWGWLLLCEHLAHGAGAIFARVSAWCWWLMMVDACWVQRLEPALDELVTKQSMGFWIFDVVMVTVWHKRIRWFLWDMAMTLWDCLRLFGGNYNAARVPIPSTIGPWFRSSGSPCRHFGVNDFEPSPLLRPILLVISWTFHQRVFSTAWTVRLLKRIDDIVMFNTFSILQMFTSGSDMFFNFSNLCL